MKQFLLAGLLFFTLQQEAQTLKSPSAFLGYELGTEFTWHHRVVDYYRYLAATVPDRMRLEEYGTTYEGRPLLLAYISSPANISALDEIRQEHLKSTQGGGTSSTAIVWLSYNVHGNESVSTEASMQTIYALLTSARRYLDNTVVIIDPCINPDGRERYVNWYKQYRNTPFQIDPNSKEHQEGWWSGRSNHYMFDLNRDWAWLTQAESRQRLRKYNEWLPHIHVDFHEQDVDEPYYFAPAAEPFHEVITDFQREFQVTLGKNHARYFDKNGWLYFTKEVFDLFYPSYGDTYPTYNGAIGMTYEQGGSGHAGLGVLTTIGDTLTLGERIAHHYTTGLSTVEVASENALRLNEEFRKFYSRSKFKYQSYVLKGNPDKIRALRHLLDEHRIAYGTGTGKEAKGFNYSLGRNGSILAGTNTLVVSTNQPKATLVTVLFEPNAQLSDSLTYDITAWSLPYAYGMEAVASESLVPARAFENGPIEQPPLDPNAYAYLADWNSMGDARFLAELLKNDIRVRYASKTFVLDGVTYLPGSLIILRADNRRIPGLAATLQAASLKFDKPLTASNTGFVDEGLDFGSESVKAILPPRVAVLGGKPTNSLDFGEVWHFFEQQLHYPVTVLHSDYFGEVPLSDYDILVLPAGTAYEEFYTKETLGQLKEWVLNGGKLIALEQAIKGLGGKDGFGIREREVPKDTSFYELETQGRSYRDAMKDEITGAIFKTRVDPTHPLAFGYGDTYFTLKLGNTRYEYLERGTVAYLESDIDPVAGFAGSEARKNRDHTLIFGVEEVGSGQVVYLADNPLFRGFWENGKLFFANALFMVN